MNIFTLILDPMLSVLTPGTDFFTWQVRNDSK